MTFGNRTTPRGPEPLFDPKTVEPPVCKSCGTGKKNLCRHDADLEQGLISRSRRRPRTCLNAYDPATAEIPY